MDKATRQKRFLRTARYGRRAQTEHVRVNHPSGNFDCVCEKSIHFFAKKKSLGCNCRGRWFGNPKYGYGVCMMTGEVRKAVKQRIEGKKLCRNWSLEIYE